MQVICPKHLLSRIHSELCGMMGSRVSRIQIYPGRHPSRYMRRLWRNHHLQQNGIKVRLPPKLGRHVPSSRMLVSAVFIQRQLLPL